jgi:hypothetical protein
VSGLVSKMSKPAVDIVENDEWHSVGSRFTSKSSEE